MQYDKIKIFSFSLAFKLESSIFAVVIWTKKWRNKDIVRWEIKNKNKWVKCEEPYDVR